ncbi:hypothetical protein EG68_11999 [Paragonimus skrjabini miyazakii]|uniref:Uncharacterized protein n=1 Tax=Paragonimus skrjabini miyazakii TaxID=59628 RepID=A0A8S9YBK7_9TREM|nr:hypothetical protein EG68_11999 [Paragonimus skrjabini miyazakii]
MSLSEMPLIGCRISIISKAKIRYEGYLHSVNCDTPNEPEITLSKVWSFGTEDRPCERPVAARNEEYNQVVFRGRDLEDVRLVQSSVFLNEDSAIVSAAPASSISLPGVSGTDRNRNANTTSSGAEGSVNTSLPSASFDAAKLSGTRSTPFSFHSPAVGPVVDAVQPDSSHTSTAGGPRPFGDGRSDGDSAVNSIKKWDILGRTGTNIATADDTSRQRTVLGSSPRLDSAQSWGNRENHTRGGGAVNMRHTNEFPTDNAGFDHFQRRRVGYPTQWSGGQRGFRFSQGGYLRRGGRMGSNQGWSRPHAGVPFTSSEPANFSLEYDYEKANAELAAELEKINISIPASASIDGETVKGSESTGSEAGEDAICYNQSKSFFDTLSSEMMDKANGVTSQGMNRRDERLLNSATFGTTGFQYPRRGGYHPRSGGAYGNFNYGQRRTGGGFWRSAGNSASKTPYKPGPPISATANVN